MNPGPGPIPLSFREGGRSSSAGGITCAQSPPAGCPTLHAHRDPIFPSLLLHFSFPVGFISLHQVHLWRKYQCFPLGGRRRRSKGCTRPCVRTRGCAHVCVPVCVHVCVHKGPFALWLDSGDSAPRQGLGGRSPGRPQEAAGTGFLLSARPGSH